MTTPAPQATTTLQFLGVDSCTPQVGGETSSMCLNRLALIDLGWCAPLTMRRFGLDPLAVRTVLVTHCHHDHYMGLAALLFYRAMNGPRGADAPSLTIVGPRTEIHNVVERAGHYLQWDRYPELRLPLDVTGLCGGGAFETDRLAASAAWGIHPTPNLCLRLEDKTTGATLGISGDTAPHPALARHFAGVDVLVHEASCGPDARDPLAGGGHSGATDAARIAADAKAKQLCLVHCPQGEGAREELLAAAEAIFPHTRLPLAGDVLELGR